MRYRILATIVLATAAVLSANAKPAPKAKDEPREVKAKIDPPGAPLEGTLDVRTDTYTLDRLGQTAAQYAQTVKEQPPVVEVDLVLVLKNTSNKEITIWTAGDYRVEERKDGGDYVRLQLDLKGPGVVSKVVAARETRPRTPPPQRRTLVPGQTWSLPITTLNFGTRGWASFEASRTCWTEPSEYTLTASFKTAVSPAPPGSKQTLFEGGYVTITTAPVKLKVIEKAKE